MSFLTYHSLDPYIRIFVSFYKYSHHRYFIDFRHIICISYRQNNFLINIIIMLGQISADFNELHTLKFYTFNACRSIKVNVSRRYPIIPFIEILVLQNINKYILCITFSVINESHGHWFLRPSFVYFQAALVPVWYEPWQKGLFSSLRYPQHG